MQSAIDRRQFLKRTGLASAAFGTVGPTLSTRAEESPNNKIVIGVMGTNGRGMTQINGFLTLSKV